MAFSTHMLLRRESDDDVAAVYLVVSLDFPSDGEWHPLGRLTLRKPEQTFSFVPLNAWAEKGITVTANDPVTPEELGTSGEYWMAWRGRIRAWAERLIAQRHFPEQYPS